MARVRLWRDEIDDGVIPPVCARCGEESGVEFQRKKFAWCPPWVIVTIFAGLLIYAILAIILTKKMTFAVPLCDRHRGHWSWRLWFIWAGLFAWFVVFVAGAFVRVNTENQRGTLHDAGGVLMAVGGFGGFVWLIASALVQNAAIQPAEITDERIDLIHVSDQFADAVSAAQDEAEAEYERRRAERRAARRRAEEFGEEA